MARARIPIEERFHPHVDKSSGPDACWPWTRSKIRDGGYGQIGRGGHDGGIVLTHRLAWEIANGPVPDGMRVLHECDNPPCCNPKHLFLGTQADNLRDMTAKGRRCAGPAMRAAQVRSSKNWRTKPHAR